MWNLEQNASAIAGFGIAPAGAAVRKIQQNLNSLTYDVVAFVAANVGHESNPAGIVFLRGMVQALGRGRATGFFQTDHRHHYIPCNGAREACVVAGLCPAGTANLVACRSAVLEC